MKFLSAIAMAVASALAAGPAPAQEQQQRPEYRPSEEYDQCMRQPDAAAGNRTAVDLCLGIEQAVQREAMGDAYTSAFDSLGTWGQVRLYNDQTEWLAGLDGRCADAVRKPDAVNTDSRAFNVCLTLEYAARAAWLAEYSPE